MTETSHSRKELWFAADILLRVMLYALLRPGELLKARVGDFRVFSAADGTRVGVLALLDPKTNDFLGRDQFALIRDEGAVAWMEWCCAGKDEHQFVWPIAASDLRHFAKSLFRSTFGSDTKLNLPSARPGGATHYFINGVALEQLMCWGRWKALATLKCYVQEAVAQLVWSDLPEKLARALVFRLKAYKRILRAPPPITLRDLLISCCAPRM